MAIVLDLFLCVRESVYTNACDSEPIHPQGIALVELGKEKSKTISELYAYGPMPVLIWFVQA